jgi:hypothetical protein
MEVGGQVAQLIDGANGAVPILNAAIPEPLEKNFAHLLQCWHLSAISVFQPLMFDSQSHNSPLGLVRE